MTTLNITEAAELLKVHPKTVLELIGSGALPAARIGRAYVMLTKDVLAHIERAIVKQTAARMGVPDIASHMRRSAALKRARPELRGV